MREGKAMKKSGVAWPVTLALLLWPIPGTAGWLNVNFKALVSRADLDYNEPARRSDEGMPVGNGRMGSLVWTLPTQLKFQINRSDVFAADGRTVSFPEGQGLAA
jgi:hypothetical protein